MKKNKNTSSFRTITTPLLILILSALACGRGTSTTRAPVSGLPQQSQPVPHAPIADLPVESGVILFQDDFQDGAAENWETSGAWYVEQSGDSYIFGAAGPGWAWVPGGRNWKDYIFHAGVRLEAGSLFLSMNLTQGSRYLLRLDQAGVYLIKEQPAGNFAILTQTGPVTMNAGHSIVIAGQGGRLMVYVDSVLWIDLTDPSPLTQGTIGVSSLDGSRVGVDNIVVALPTGGLPAGVVQAPPPLLQQPLSVNTIEEELAGQSLDDVEIEGIVEQESPAEPPRGAQPDLVVADVTFDPDPVIQGQPFQAAYSFSNQGQGDAGAFTVRLHFLAATGLADCNADFPSLGAGQSAWGGCTRTTNSQAGTSPTEFTVDVEGEIPETNENNNLATPTLTVITTAEDSGGEVAPEAGGGGGGAPDLVVTDVHFEPDPVIRGQPFQVVYAIANQGDRAAEAFTVRLHFHAAVGLADCNADYNTLAAGQSAWGGCTRTTNAQPGTSPTEFTVDVEGEIAESNEGNNFANPTLTVIGQ
jgi:hypothetical protein